MMTTNPHTVNVTAETGLDPEDAPCGTPDVTFTCTAPDTAECRNYPNEVEFWYEDDPRSVPQPECWAESWFREDLFTYAGPDARGFSGADGLPNIDRTGPVTITYDDGLEWAWEETS